MCSAIEDLSSTSAQPFEDPFSADMAAFAKQFLVHGFETPALPLSDATSEGTSSTPHAGRIGSRTHLRSRRPQSDR